MRYCLLLLALLVLLLSCFTPRVLLRYCLLLLALLVLLPSCVTPRVLPSPIVDPTTWQEPPVGTPVALRVFYGRKRSIDLPGVWGSPINRWIVSFEVYRTLERVVRVEVLLRGRTIWARNFDSPKTLTEGSVVGWARPQPSKTAK